MLDGELEAHNFLNVNGVAIVVLVQLEQLQRAMTQLLHLLVAVANIGQVVVVGSSSSSSGRNNISPMITLTISIDTTRLISSPSMSM
jgi:hypothetical protein